MDACGACSPRLPQPMSRSVTLIAGSIVRPIITPLLESESGTPAYHSHVNTLMTCEPTGTSPS